MNSKFAESVLLGSTETNGEDGCRVWREINGKFLNYFVGPTIIQWMTRGTLHVIRNYNSAPRHTVHFRLPHNLIHCSGVHTVIIHLDMTAGKKDNSRGKKWRDVIVWCVY